MTQRRDPASPVAASPRLARARASRRAAACRSSSAPPSAAPRWSRPTAARSARRSTTRPSSSSSRRAAATATATRMHVNVTSYNGVVLLTGEVPDAATKAALAEHGAHHRPRAPRARRARRAAAHADVRAHQRHVHHVEGEGALRRGEQVLRRTHVKVVTERGVVYLMGLVRPDEGDAAAQIAAQHDRRRARRQALRVRSSRRWPAARVALPEPRYPAKIATRADALARIAALPRPLVLTNGVFDVLHRRPRHVSRAGARRSARRWSSRSTPTPRCGASARATTARSTRSTTAWRCSRRSHASTSSCRSTTTRRATSSSRAMPDVLVKGGDYTRRDHRRRRRSDRRRRPLRRHPVRATRARRRRWSSASAPAA